MPVLRSVVATGLWVVAMAKPPNMVSLWKGICDHYPWNQRPNLQWKGTIDVSCFKSCYQWPKSLDFFSAVCPDAFGFNVPPCFLVNYFHGRQETLPLYDRNLPIYRFLFVCRLRLWELLWRHKCPLNSHFQLIVRQKLDYRHQNENRDNFKQIRVISKN